MINGGIGGVSVGWDANGGGIINGVLYFKVMTDEQFEILHAQIVVYTIVTKQLVEMHKNQCPTRSCWYFSLPFVVCRVN